MFTFQSAKPEEFGIPSEAVTRLEEMYEQWKVNIHGYMLIGGNKVLAERYWQPYDEEKQHRMYSCRPHTVALIKGHTPRTGMSLFIRAAFGRVFHFCQNTGNAAP